MTPETFLSEIWEGITVDGRTLPLPDNWRLKVVVIPATVDDWHFAITKAIEATEREWNPVKHKALFDYSIGVLWNRLAERTDIDCRPLKPYYPSAEAEMQAIADRLAAEIGMEEARDE